MIMTKDKRIEFPKRLRELRHTSLLTQIRLSEKLNISRSCLANYETGKRFPDDSILGIIAAFFNVTREYLLGEEEFFQKNTSEEIAFLKIKSKKLKKGKLDLTDFSSTSKIALVEFCKFLEDKEGENNPEQTC